MSNQPPILPSIRLFSKQSLSVCCVPGFVLASLGKYMSSKPSRSNRSALCGSKDNWASLEVKKAIEIYFFTSTFVSPFRRYSQHKNTVSLLTTLCQALLIYMQFA